MEFKLGEVIFNQGDLGDYAYLIEKGKVEIFHTKKNGQLVHLAFLGEGELFGEMALFDANIRTASTKAVTDCSLLRIKKEQLFERVNASDKIVQLIIRVLMKRLNESNMSVVGESAAISPLRITSEEVENGDGDALAKLKFENELNEAYLQNEFKIYHQPIVEMDTEKIVGSEALIRWESPTKGLVSPGKFVDILENSAMIIPVGYWIIEQCFLNYKEIKKRNPDMDFSISINVSGRQFLHFDFLPKLKQLLEKHQVPAKQFKLEITERILLEGGGIIDILDRCADLGFSISLDDFGTGFSSLQYLARMPISFIKIDRSFVMNIQKDHKTLAVVSSIIYLAKKLNIKIIAEGIETAVEKQIMQGLGSEYAQGYLFSKPVSFSEFLNLLR
jgi:EAL domain-containing protein (putative c-di-GMP-specific phosphodiesterase class I)